MKKKKKILNVPLEEYFDETRSSYLGVVFLVHGHTGSKEFEDLQNLPIGFMKRGYFVVSIDAYKHGARIEEPYLTKSALEMSVAMPEVMMHTIQDIIGLFKNHYKRISPNLIVSGTSMGGHISFQMPSYCNEVVGIFPFIGTPDIRSHYFETKKEILGDAIDRCRNLVDALSIKELNPYMDVVIGIYNGSIDPIVESKFVRPFFDNLEAKYHPHLELKEYPVGHEVTNAMIEDMFSFFDREMA